ncbi:MAG: alpha/beta hydrolase [Microthrixaceae bacterium]
MSIGFTIGAVLIAAITLAAWRPPHRPRHLVRAGYFFGLAPNEIPQVWVLILTASTVAAIADDGLPTMLPGWVVLTMTVATIVGLIGLSHRALGTAPTLTEALDEAGFDAGGVGRRPIWQILLTPIPFRPRRVERIANISYGTGRRRRLDVYRSRSAITTSAPVLVYFHGGGYFGGDKHREARLLLHRLADQGWVCVSAGYRVQPEASFPEHLIDAKAAIGWVRDHAADYGADPSTLVVAGSSAGAHLASLAALTPNESVFQPGFEDSDTAIRAVIGLYGYYGRYYGRGDNEFPASTPLAYDATDAPPFLLIDAGLDSQVPVAESRALADHLRDQSSNPVVRAELPGAQHGFDMFRSVRFDAVVDSIEAFLKGCRLGPPEITLDVATDTPRGPDL